LLLAGNVYFAKGFTIRAVTGLLVSLLKSVIVLLVFWKPCAGISPSLCETELDLHSDSTDATAWARYGLALLADGESRSEWVLNNGISIAETPEGLCGLASISVQKGNLSEAIRLLMRDTVNTSSRIMLCSVLQESGETSRADFVLRYLTAADSFSDTAGLLRIRQLRREGFSGRADSLAIELLRTAGHELLPLIELDLLLASDSVIAMDCPDILKAMKTDFILTGSVYLSRILSEFASARMESEKPFQAAQILALSGDQKNAERILSRLNTQQMSLDELVFYGDLLLQTDKLNEAESVVRVGLNNYPDSPALNSTLGMILLKGGRYQETYDAMKEAVELTGSPECMAVMGLAAEYAGEFILAVEAYSPLLELSADSVVLINRTRNWFREDLLGTLTVSNVWQNGNSSFGGNLSASYYESTGKYPQKNLSLGGSVRYRYGLYNSRVSVSTHFSNKDWPGAESKLKMLNLATYWRNYSSRNLYQNLSVSWEHSRDKTTRWKLESIASCGYSVNFSNNTRITPSVGIGRIINRWDDEMYQRDSYVYTLGLIITFSDLIGSFFRPSVTLNGNVSRDFSNSDQYEADAGIRFSAALNSILSLSYSYSVDYQSIVPPENKSELNTSTMASLNFHF